MIVECLLVLLFNPAKFIFLGIEEAGRLTEERHYERDHKLSEPKCGAGAKISPCANCSGIYKTVSLSFDA